MNGFTVERIDGLELQCSSPLSFMYKLSPYVWRENARCEMLVRAVNHSPNPPEKVARIYHGCSHDGLAWVMDDHPVIAPGAGPDDKDGCEDPTVAIQNGNIYVYYTGWNETARRGQLLLATGAYISCLEKRGIALASRAGCANPKEATIVAVTDGSWRLFFEYAAADASKIGIAAGPAVDGPWTVLPPLFDARPDSWDNWHLSPGPILSSEPERPVMFYNGATRDAKWRIGWIAFDQFYTRVVARCGDPLIVPPPGEPGDTDIAFAASSLEADGQISLYYSVADKAMFRALLRRS